MISGMPNMKYETDSKTKQYTMAANTLMFEIIIIIIIIKRLYCTNTYIQSSKRTERWKDKCKGLV